MMEVSPDDGEQGDTEADEIYDRLALGGMGHPTIWKSLLQPARNGACRRLQPFAVD